MNQIKLTYHQVLILLFIVALTMAGMLYLGHRQHQRINSFRSQWETDQATIRQYRNTQGKWVTEKQAAEIRIQELDKKLQEQIRRDFGVKPRDIAGYVRNEFGAEGSGNARIEFIDSHELYIDTVNMERWLSITAQPMPHGSGYYYLANGDTVVLKVTHDGNPLFPYDPFAIVVQDGYLDFQAEVYSEIRAPYKYTYTDTMEFVFHKRRDKFLGPKKLYGSGLLRNPNAVIRNTQAFLVEDRPSRFGIGPSVSYGVSPNGLQWNLGISVHYSLIRF